MDPRSDIPSFVYRLAFGFDGTVCAILMAYATDRRRYAALEVGKTNPRNENSREEYEGEERARGFSNVVCDLA